MKIKKTLIFLLLVTMAPCSIALVGKNQENIEVGNNLMSKWNAKLSSIEDKNNISVVEEKNGQFTIKTPIISFLDDSKQKKYSSKLLLKKDTAKLFGHEPSGIKLSTTKNSQFYKNVVSSKSDNFEIELGYMQDPGKSDEINLWRKDVTIVFY